MGAVPWVIMSEVNIYQHQYDFLIFKVAVSAHLFMDESIRANSLPLTGQTKNSVNRNGSNGLNGSKVANALNILNHYIKKVRLLLLLK